jgi:hypothetical protein
MKSPIVAAGQQAAGVEVLSITTKKREMRAVESESLKASETQERRSAGRAKLGW